MVLAQPHYLNEDQMQIVYGSLLGDGSIYQRKEHIGKKSHLRLGHSTGQREYLEYKANLLRNVTVGEIKPIHNKASNGFYINTIALYEIDHLSTYRKDKLIPQEVADNLNPLGLAIWYMDDGTYSGYHEKWGNGKSKIYCFKFKNREIMLPAFHRMGLFPKLDKRGFIFDSENTIKLHQIISRFVPEIMQYKLHPSYSGLFGFEEQPLKEIEYKTISGGIISIGKLKTKLRRKYDLTVEDNATYIVGGAVVHNSPETTGGGGNALPFYASCRMRTQAQKKILNAKHKTVVGVNLKIKNVKNRAFKPFFEVENIKLYFDAGIDPLSGLLSTLLKSERIVAGDKANTYLVKPEYLEDGMNEYKFKAKLSEDFIDRQVVLDCPKLIDATSREQVELYLKDFEDAMSGSNSDDFIETNVSSDDLDELVDEIDEDELDDSEENA